MSRAQLFWLACLFVAVVLSGMGVVYEAHQEALDRKVAIKRNMGANYRDKVARRDALRNEGVKTLEVSVNPNRTEPEPDDGAE